MGFASGDFYGVCCIFCFSIYSICLYFHFLSSLFCVFILLYFLPIIYNIFHIILYDL